MREHDVRAGIDAQIQAEREMELRAGKQPVSEEQKRRELARLMEMEDRKRRERGK